MALIFREDMLPPQSRYFEAYNSTIVTVIGMLLMNNKRGKPSSKRSLSCAPSWVSIQNRETTQRNLKRDSCSLNHHHYLLFIIDSFSMFCSKLAKKNWDLGLVLVLVCVLLLVYCNKSRKYCK